MSEREPFDADERRALDAWSAASPPADVASRVLQRASHGRRRRRMVIGLAAAAALIGALGGAALLAGRGGQRGRSGSRQLIARETLAIGDRAVAVAEAGSALSWRVDDDGAARVEQRAGNVFYRVASGATFRVGTPLGSVTVLGTCFRVTIGPSGSGGKPTALVTVHEGRVRAESPGFAGREISAGQAAYLDGRSSPRLRSVAIAATAGTAPPTAGPSSRPGRAAGRSVGPMAGKLSQKLSRLEREVGALRRALAKARGKADKTQVVDLDKRELAEMAQRCELRWDMPSLTMDKPPKVSNKHRELLGLQPGEIAAVEQVFSKHHHEVVAALRKLYVEVTGDKQAATALSPWSLISEITGKSPRAERKVVFSQLARERAGLATATANERRSAFERMMRLLTTIGGRLEKEIGARIGLDLARRYRREAGGFGSRSRSSYGCPKPDKRP